MSFTSNRSFVATHAAPSTTIRNAVSRVKRASVAVLLASALVESGRAQTQQFTDGAFGATWASTKIVDTTGGTATFTSTTVAAGGIPGAYRDTSHTFGSGAIIVAHMNSAAVLDPSSVLVQSIDFSYDLDYFDAGTVGGAVAYRLALLQGGSYYGTGNDNIFVNSWTSFAHTGLQANDFTLVSGTGPAVPDLSCTGAPITLGFLSANSQGGSTPITKDSGLDNWSVTVHVAGTIYMDGTFAPPGWVSTKIVDTTGGGATFTTSTVAGGGNPTAYLETSHTYGAGTIVVNHANTAAVYNLSSTGITSLDYSYDLNHLTGTSVGGNVAYALSIVQGGVCFSTAYDNIGPNSWQSFSHANVHASDFTRVTATGPTNPDFTINGAPITLGVVSANSQGGSSPVTKVSGMDNWTVTVLRGNPCPGLGPPFCFCDGNPNVGPCVNNGLPGRGCENSSSTGGALLSASGTVSPDTVVLNVVGLRGPGTTCVYYQGRTPISPVLYGDGLRCVTGTLKRLYVKPGSNGNSFAPQSGDLGIRAQSTQKNDVIPSPGTRYYYVAYRDPVSTFCPTPTGGFFNATNAVSIIWP